MRKSLAIIDALQEAVINRTNKEPGVIFEINPLDALDLEDVPEEAFVSRDFDEPIAEEIVAGLQIGRLEPLGNVWGVKFVPHPRAASLWGNT